MFPVNTHDKEDAAWPVGANGAAAGVASELTATVQHLLTAMQHQQLQFQELVLKTLTTHRQTGPSQMLSKMTPDDDIEGYLRVFEQTAECEKWAPAEWTITLAPFLCGEAQKAYVDLNREAACNYQKLKAEILARLGVTTVVQAQRFYDWQYNPERPGGSQLFDQLLLAKKWLNPELNSPGRVVELMVMDRFIRSLPTAARERVAERDPSTLDDTIAALERYIAAQVLGHADRQVQEKRGTTIVKSLVRLDPKLAPADDRHREPRGPHRHLLGKQEAPAAATKQEAFTGENGCWTQPKYTMSPNQLSSQT
ncbi:uncharacterized protein LOC121317413 [Polyodon spathula]|uniref:uncharacterized protein LOC121317413 n=1 Tax=Polyodon spathula TaxID=7913 RepID=UPI001B7E40F2|nr:uncharacterized protein LOC121317413 [Polyodon spathula]